MIDRPDIFEATVNIEGASSSDAICRLVLETDNLKMLFDGKLSGENCKIRINKLKKYITEGDTGTLKLEVIADDMYFSPWSSKFKAKLSKKVTVEVADNSNIEYAKPKVIVKEVSNQTVNYDKDILIREMSKHFKKFKMKLEDVSKRKKTVNHVITKLMESGHITSDMKDDPSLIDVVIEAIVLSEKIG